MSFEEMLSRLDEITVELAGGGATLEKSLDLYAEGCRLLAECEKKLGTAKVKIEKLMPGEASNNVHFL